MSKRELMLFRYNRRVYERTQATTLRYNQGVAVGGYLGLKKTHLEGRSTHYLYFASEAELIRKESGWFEARICHSRLTVTVTVVECDIVPLVPVTVTV